ncbi:MAG: penicillin acylase family protein [Planctomycetota bacterium]|jgi:penicillin amidase|nr:penicillin acylase family protein [Planctomycetota bacterium]
MAAQLQTSIGGLSPATRRGLVGGGIVLVIAVALVGGWLELRRVRAARNPQLEGTVRVEGLQAPLRIVRDRNGVPHVRAESSLDAWLGLGFVHAQDRLGQMLHHRAAAWGRSAEHEGGSALEADRWARTLGFGRLAEAQWQRTRRAEREMLEAYAAGVNGWLVKVRSGRVGLPLGLRDAESLEPWRPVDSLALLKHRAWTLGATIEESLTLEELIRRLGPTLARAFFPEAARGSAQARRHFDGHASVPRIRERSSRPDSGGLPAVGAPFVGRPVQESEAPPWRDPLRARAGHRGGGVGGSAFLVRGSLSRRGAPLLAADAHFAAQAPAELHQADLRGGGLAVAGAAVPGIPVFWTGFNPDLAWAVTQVPAVVSDLVVETLHAGGEARVFAGKGWRALTTREEEIRVRGGSTHRLTVRSTPRGPLVHELLGSDVPMSVQWMGAQRGAALRAFRELARARDADVAQRVLRHHREPLVAVLVADRADGFFQVAGAAPARELPSGLVPLPSGNPAYHWRGAIDFDDLPSLGFSQRRPWLVAADQPLGRRAGKLELLWRSGARAERIVGALQDLRAKGRMEEGDLVGLQGDARSQRAVALIEAALAVGQGDPPRSREAREVVRLLEDWDGDMAPGRREAAAYHVFLGRVLRYLFEPDLGSALLERLAGLRGIDPTWLVGLALGAPAADGPAAAPWAQQERVAAAVQRSLRETWIELSVTLGPNREKWGWGRLHPLSFRRRQPERFGSRRALGPFPFGGDATTLRFGGYRPLESYEADAVAVHRMVVDASDLDQALVFLAPGQTEQPAHRWEADGIARWLEGRPALLSTRDPVIADAQVAELRLEPEVARTSRRSSEPATGAGPEAGG